MHITIQCCVHCAVQSWACDTCLGVATSDIVIRLLRPVVGIAIFKMYNTACVYYETTDLNRNSVTGVNHAKKRNVIKETPFFVKA